MGNTPSRPLVTAAEYYPSLEKSPEARDPSTGTSQDLHFYFTAYTAQLKDRRYSEWFKNPSVEPEALAVLTPRVDRFLVKLESRLICGKLLASPTEETQTLLRNIIHTLVNFNEASTFKGCNFPDRLASKIISRVFTTSLLQRLEITFEQRSLFLKEKLPLVLSFDTCIEDVFIRVEVSGEISYTKKPFSDPKVKYSLEITGYISPLGAMSQK